jgi:hypothetical protein
MGTLLSGVVPQPRRLAKQRKSSSALLDERYLLAMNAAMIAEHRRQVSAEILMRGMPLSSIILMISPIGGPM